MRKGGRGKQILCQWGIVAGCVLWLAGCGGENRSFLPQEEALCKTRRVDAAEESQVDLLFQEASDDTALPETPACADPYENSIYELLDEESTEDWLKIYGMDAVSPVCFHDLDGKLKLELYYDRETGRGCGLKYVETSNGTDLLGFRVDGYQRECFWNYPNPYATDLVYETAASAEVDQLSDLLEKIASEFQDTFEYDREGKLIAWHLKGHVETGEEEGRQEELLTVFFSYTEEGILREKVYQFHEELVPYRELGGNQRYVYDERERLLYAEFETVMGDCYFVYEEDALVPCAWLEVDQNYVFLTKLEDRGYDNWLEIPREGAEAFLRQIGLDFGDQIYEYRNDDDEHPMEAWRKSVLTLYYDPQKELGGGYEYFPGRSVGDRGGKMTGFQFKGCVEIDCRRYDPYEVFADYHDVPEQQYVPDEIGIHCLPPEELPDTYSYEGAYVCEYREDRLVRVQMDRCCGSLERFYIYEGESDQPSYCLNLFYGCRPGVTLFKFIY